MNRIEDLTNLYVAHLRAVFLTHQNSHWVSRGTNFYGTHLMLDRVYQSAAKDADSAAEKVIGVFGDEALDPKLQAQFISKLLEKAPDGDPVETSLAVEKDFLKFSQQFYNTIKTEGKMTQGLDDLILGIANSREEAVYLLGQATKQSGSKFASRKAALISLGTQSVDPNWLQEKLTNRLMAVVPSYIQGTYNSSDFTVSIETKNKRILANVKLPKPIAPDIQNKIEKNFQQFAYSILPDNMKTFAVLVSFVSMTK